MENKKSFLALFLEEEEDDDLVLLTLDDRGEISGLLKRKRVKGTFNVLIENHLKANDQKFKEYFRLNKMQFQQVLNIIRPEIETPPNRFVQQPISAYEKLAVTLRLKQELGREFLEVGCSVHVLKNCLQCAADNLPFDLKVIVVKIYGYFYIYTVRVNKLKEFCDFVEVEYEKSQEKVPQIIFDFFQWKQQKPGIHAQSSMFHRAILKIEGNNISLMEVMKVILELQTKLEERLREVYIPLAVRNILTKLEEQGHECMMDFKKVASNF
ncbi:unnamed protein product [Brassicogethes aeneus]|uniref:Uncharacterized protein n=1 Tax=Brassicogethes aeneus TaxID=1431903 RepID=A0A9P0BJ50_BRAAE|nr:unnamed protein product [Brassicogethes aeneus]